MLEPTLLRLAATYKSIRVLSPVSSYTRTRENVSISNFTWLFSVIFNNYNYNSGNICPTVNVGGVSMSLL